MATTTVQTVIVPGNGPRILKQATAADLIVLRIIQDLFNAGRKLTRLRLLQSGPRTSWDVEARDHEGADHWVVPRGSKLPTSISIVIEALAPFLEKPYAHKPWHARICEEIERAPVLRSL